MTAIAAVTDGKTVWMGGDSAATSGWDLTLISGSKLFKSGEFLIGFSGELRAAQVLRYGFTPPTLGPEDDLDRYLVTTFANAVRDAMKVGGCSEKTNDKEKLGTDFLLGIRGRLFEIAADFSIVEASWRYGAIGCGGGIAKGSLHATQGQTAESRVRLALQAAERHSAGVRGPFTILSIGG